MATFSIPAVRPAKPISDEALAGDLIQRGHAFFGLIWINSGRLTGAPCFAGTRVPIKNLFDYIESGYSIDEFLADFEGVTKEQATAIIDLASEGLLAELPKA